MENQKRLKRRFDKKRVKDIILIGLIGYSFVVSTIYIASMININHDGCLREYTFSGGRSFSTSGLKYYEIKRLSFSIDIIYGFSMDVCGSLRLEFSRTVNYLALHAPTKIGESTLKSYENGALNKVGCVNFSIFFETATAFTITINNYTCRWVYPTYTGDLNEEVGFGFNYGVELNPSDITNIVAEIRC